MDDSRPGGRRVSDSWWAELDELKKRFDHMEITHDQRMRALESNLGINTASTMRVESLVREALETIKEAAQLASGLKNAGRLADWAVAWATKWGKPASYIATTAAALLAFYATYQGLK